MKLIWLSDKLPLTKQGGETLLDKISFGVLWGHQDFLKQPSKEENSETRCFSCNYYQDISLNIFTKKQNSWQCSHFFQFNFFLSICALLHCLLRNAYTTCGFTSTVAEGSIYLGCLWTGHANHNVMQSIYPANRSMILHPVKMEMQIIHLWLHMQTCTQSEECTAHNNH